MNRTITATIVAAIAMLAAAAPAGAVTVNRTVVHNNAADADVDSINPTANNGTSTLPHMTAASGCTAGPRKILERFRVDGPQTGEEIVGLRMELVQSAYSPSTDGLLVRAELNHGWNESTVTWNSTSWVEDTALSVGASSVSTSTSSPTVIDVGPTYIDNASLPVTGQVDQRVDFVLTSTGCNRLFFDDRQATGARRIKLYVDYGTF